MKVLDRDLIPEFIRFWEDIKSELDVTEFDITSASSAVFGDQSVEALGGAKPAWMQLPDLDLAHHIAHELAHQLLRKRGYPRIGRGIRYGTSSSEARVGGDLEELVIHIPLDALLAEYGFSNKVIVERMFNGAKEGITSSPVPDYGSPWFFTWAIRYAELTRMLTDSQMGKIDDVFREKCNEIRMLGKELLLILRRYECWTPSQTKRAMMDCRDTLGLGVDGRVLIIDGEDGTFS